MLVNHIKSRICNSRIGEVILIGDSTISLDYENEFMESLYVVNNRSQTRALSPCYLHRVLECN